MTEREKQALEKVIDYCWAGEHADYEREGEPEGHIFEEIQILDGFLRSEKR